MTVIITDIRYRMSLALIRTLSQAGVKIIVCESDFCLNNKKSPPLGFYSKYAKEKIYLSEANFKEELFELCKKICDEDNEKPILMPVSAKTTALLTKNEDEFKSVASFLLPNADQYELLNDKSMMADLADKLDIPTPKDYSILLDNINTSANELNELSLKEINYPCVIKPVCGEKLGLSAKDRYVIAKSQEELLVAYAHFKSFGDNVVVQEYLEGSGFGCSVFAHNGKIVSFICHERLREYPISGGPSACCESIFHTKMIEYAKKFTSHIGFSGFVMFEFKGNSKNEVNFLETNPRIWGSFPLVRASNSPMILSWLEAAQKYNDPAFSIAKPAPYKFTKMQFVISDLSAGFSYLKSGNVKKFIQCALDTLNPFVKDGLFEFNDPVPFFVYLKSLLNR